MMIGSNRGDFGITIFQYSIILFPLNVNVKYPAAFSSSREFKYDLQISMVSREGKNYVKFEGKSDKKIPAPEVRIYQSFLQHSFVERS